MKKTREKAPHSDSVSPALLQAALRAQFSEQAAGHLARLFDTGLSAETITYEQIDLPRDQRDDIILTAFEERALIPIRSSSSAAWEDRVLSLAPGERYFMPGVVRILLAAARESARLDPHRAVESVLCQQTATLPEAAGQCDRLAAFVAGLKGHATSYKAEVGLMKAVARECRLTLDLHDVIDILVICGILSPCTHGPVIAGLSWYEINACLYWCDEKL
jgi:hypothetical protein